MISTTRDYGTFAIDGYTDELTIHIQRMGNESPQELVKQAIMFANENKCRISRKVEYIPNDGVSFKVKCDGNTSRYIYDYGKMIIHRASCTDKDIKAYKRNFGTDRCIHKGLSKSTGTPSLSTEISSISTRSMLQRNLPQLNWVTP